MSESDHAQQTTLNIPQLLVLLAVGFLALRWLTSPRAPPPPGSSTRPGATAAGTTQQRAANARHVETILQMFPQLDQRTIMWELQRNGNNVQMLTERVLAGRRLETPPQSFQPVLPQATGDAPSARPVAPKKSNQPDLIKRYNLDSKLQTAQEIKEAEQAAKPVWSPNKTERQTSLQQRREEMILAARRKMQQKKEASSS